MSEDAGGDQYAAISTTYRETEEMPIRRCAEFPTMLALLGSVEGADVLDLACGSGTYCRMLAALGARHVIGVDVSEAMVEQARAKTPADERVEYHVHDVATMPRLGEFDILTASFLLNYAQTRAELAAMCRAIADQLRQDGRFAGTLPNSAYDLERALDTRYGFAIHWTPGMQDGDRLTFDLYLSTTLHLECWHWTLDTYRESLQDAGLRQVEFHPWLPGKEGIDELGAEFWQPWVDNPMLMVVTGWKA